MKKRHLVLAVLSALGLLALDRAGGPAGSIVRLGPLEWSFTVRCEPAETNPAPLQRPSEAAEPLRRVS